MLAPAVHIMHQVWKGMAWVAEGIEEEDNTRSYDVVEQGLSTSDSHSDQAAQKRLSTIVESSCSIMGDRVSFLNQNHSLKVYHSRTKSVVISLPDTTLWSETLQIAQFQNFMCHCFIHNKLTLTTPLESMEILKGMQIEKMEVRSDYS